MNNFKQTVLPFTECSFISEGKHETPFHLLTNRAAPAPGKKQLTGFSRSGKQPETRSGLAFPISFNTFLLIIVAFCFCFYPAFAENSENNTGIKRIIIFPYLGSIEQGEDYIRNILPERMALFFNQSEGILAVSPSKEMLKLKIAEPLSGVPDDTIIKKFRDDHIDYVLLGYLKNKGITFYLLNINSKKSESLNIDSSDKFSFSVLEKLIPWITEKISVKNSNSKSITAMIHYQSIPAFLKYEQAFVLFYGDADVDKALASVNESLKINPDDISAKALLAQVLTRKGEYDRGELLFDEVLRQCTLFTPAVTGKGILLMAKDENDKAAKFLEDKLKDFPSSILLMFNCALANERGGDWENAELYYEKIIKIDPFNYAALYNLASMYFKNRQYMKSLPLFEKLEKENPEDVIFPYNIASAYLFMGKTEAARKKLLEIAEKGDYKEVDNDLGVIFRREKNYDEAEKYFRKALALDPAYSPAYNNLGILYILKGDPEKAEESLNKAIQYNIRDTDALYNLGILFLRQKDYDRAWLFFSRAYDISPGFVNAGINLAITEMYRGNLKESERILLGLSGKFTDNAMVLYNLGVLYKSMGMPEKAMEYFDNALEVEPKFADALNNIGVIFIGQNKWKQAVLILNKALEISPDNPVYLFNRGLASYYGERYDDAELFFGKALMVNPEYHNAGLFLIRANLLNGKYQEAGNNIDLMMKEYSGDYQLVYLKAVWYERTGQTQKAVETLEKILEQYQDFLEGYQKLGLLYISLQKYDKAEKVYHRLTAVDPGDYESWINLGNIYMAEKKNFLAEKTFGRAINAAPGKAIVYHHRGMFFVNSGNFRGAASDYTSAVKLEPGNVDYLSNLALSLAMINKCKEAEGYMHKALEIKPGNPVLLYRLAFVYTKMKDREKLLKILKEAIAKDPSIKTRLLQDEDFKEYWKDKDFKSLTM